MPRHPTKIVSSEHLVSESSAELSELEYGLIMASNAFNRWMVRCMSAAGAKDMTAVEVSLLHHVNHRDRKKKLAAQICQALEVHTEIEHEIFYPAFLEATEEEDIHHEAEVEHESAKKLIAEIEGSGPDDDYYDAKVKVLSEMIKHHVNEEEKRDGMFAKARQSDMDLKELGSQLAARKQDLMGDARSTKIAAKRSGEPGVFGRLVRRVR